VASPQVLDVRRIELSDPAVSGSTQPYHAAMGKLQTDEAKVERLRQVIKKAADRSVEDLLNGFRDGGRSIQVAGIVTGSDIDPARITNPHIRAHALEGRLFRTVLENALCLRGLTCSVVVERDIYKQGVEKLNRAEADLKRWVSRLGHGRAGPWRSDEKTAALAALRALTAAEYGY